MPWNHSGQCPLWPMTVARDHGYCCLQTKAVPGAAFEGASDGGVVGSTRTDHNAKQGGFDKNRGNPENFFFSVRYFFTSTFFSENHFPSGYYHWEVTLDYSGGKYLFLGSLGSRVAAAFAIKKLTSPPPSFPSVNSAAGCWRTLKMKAR